MQLTIRQVFDAVPALDAIIREKRPMPQLGKFRLARMHARLLAEFATANVLRDELITRHGDRREDGTFWVPPERLAEFNADWDPIAAATVEVDIAPVHLADLLLGTSADPANGAIEVNELLALGELVAE